MSGKGKRKLAVLVTCIMGIMMLLPAAAVSAVVKQDYLALGDSISYGYSDPANGGYANLFADYLGDGYNYTRLNKPGYTTQDLLCVIRNNKTIIRNADIMTISIGSNHLLGPVVSALAGLYNIDPAVYSDPTGADLMADLALAIQADWADGGTTPEQRIALLTDLSQPEFQDLNSSMLGGTLLFSMQWPLIMSQIHYLAPKASVYVTNLYNPLLSSVLINPALLPLFTLVDVYMKSINEQISRYSSRYGYEVVDVYKEFADPAKYSDMASNPLSAPITFNIPAALTIAGPGYTPPDHFTLFFLACDPHPSTVGHQLIFEKLKSMQ